MRCLIALFIACCFLFSCTSRDERLQKLGNGIVEKIEGFKKTNGYLPGNLSEVGII